MCHIQVIACHTSERKREREREKVCMCVNMNENKERMRDGWKKRKQEGKKEKFEWKKSEKYLRYFHTDHGEVEYRLSPAGTIGVDCVIFA